MNNGEVHVTIVASGTKQTTFSGNQAMYSWICGRMHGSSVAEVSFASLLLSHPSNGPLCGNLFVTKFYLYYPLGF